MNYLQAVAELEALPIMPERAPSLDPTLDGIRRLGISFPASRVVIVAGTNGKGTTSATLEALLLEASQSTGLYTSPHLIEITERFRRDGRDISQEEFTQAYVAVREKLGSLVLTHFEILTLMALWIFAGGTGRKPVDWLILEVGLGGTWDATNAIPHRNCVITTLDYDHQNLLGKTLPEIAANKFGVIPKLSPPALVVHTELPEEVLSLARETELRTGAKFVPAIPWSCEVKPGPRFFLKTRWGETELALPGARAAQNAATALTIFEKLGFDPARALPGLGKIRWPGRMERVDGTGFGARCPVYLSGDHNPQGVRSLLELLPHYKRTTLHLLAGIGKDKDLDGILGPLRDLPATKLYLTTTPFRGRAIEDYGAWLKKVDGVFPNPLKGLEQIAHLAQASDLIIVTGSLYLVGSCSASLSMTDSEI